LVTAQIFEINLKTLPNLSNGRKFIKSSTCRFIGAKLNKKPNINKKINISILPKFSNGSKFTFRPAQFRKWMKLNIGQNSAQYRVSTVVDSLAAACSAWKAAALVLQQISTHYKAIHG
jgi:hypothetical protein